MDKEITITNSCKDLSLAEIPVQNLTRKHREIFTKTELPTEATFIGITNSEQKFVAAAICSPNTRHLPENKNVLFIDEIWQSNEHTGYLPALLYMVLRRGRIWQKKHVVTNINSTTEWRRILRMNELNSLLATQTIDYAIHLAYQNCHHDSLEFVKIYFGQEVVETVKSWLKHFFENNIWVQTIVAGKITRRQYIASLFNIHTYVRYTTRLCARCIAYCDNPELRDHYINHLRGEINHERIIEKDLRHLGEDVDYLMNYYEPNTETKEFMITQESTIAFYQDPILMLACPLAAEGITAAVTNDFLQALYRCIESWGVPQPKEAARFIYSHRNTDGGEDGHWARVIMMIQRFVKDEYVLRKFLSILNIATEGLDRSFASNIEQNEFLLNA